MLEATRVNFVWKRFLVFLFANSTACSMYNIIRPNINIFILRKKVRWLAAIRSSSKRVRVYVCPVVFAAVTQRLTGLFYFFFLLRCKWRWSPVRPVHVTHRSPAAATAAAAVVYTMYIYRVSGSGGGSRGNCLWTSSPGKLENADCPADGNEWQSCDAAFFLFLLLLSVYFPLYSFPFSFLTRLPSLIFFLPPPPPTQEVLFPYICIHGETAVRRFPAATAERNNKRISGADEEIRYDNSGGEYKKYDETENRSGRVASLDRWRIIRYMYRWKIVRNILHRRAVYFISMTVQHTARGCTRATTKRM